MESSQQYASTRWDNMYGRKTLLGLSHENCVHNLTISRRIQLAISSRQFAELLFILICYAKQLRVKVNQAKHTFTMNKYVIFEGKRYFHNLIFLITNS